MPTKKQKEHIREWVVALRSGKYKGGDTEGRLRKVSKEGLIYSVLGVACDVSGVGEWGAAGFYVQSYDGSGNMSKAVVAHYGVNEKGGMGNPRIPRPLGEGKYGEPNGLVCLNGDHTFTVLADAIEAYYLKETDNE